VKLPRLLITDALAFHTLREYANRKVWRRGASIPGPRLLGTGGTLSMVWRSHRDRRPRQRFGSKTSILG